MHEYSIVQSLLEQCEEYARSNDATQVTKVVVKIGRLSGVEPHLLQTAFETFKEQTVCDGAQFVMQLQPVVIRCNACGFQTTLDIHHFLCGNCQSNDVSVTDGEEMLLMSLEMH